MLFQINWISCSKCSLHFPTKESVLIHQSKRHAQSKQSHKKKTAYSCTLCFTKCNQYVNYLKHMRSKHPEYVQESWLACSQCPVFYPNQVLLQKHVFKIHQSQAENDNSSDINQVPESRTTSKVAKETLVNQRSNNHCELCSKTFRQYVNYLKHMRKMHSKLIEETWISCRRCKKLYPDLSSLEKHEMRAHGRDQSVPDSSAAKHRISSSLYMCHLCNISYAHSNQYFGHMRSKHSDSVRRTWISCSRCPHMFPTHESVKAHVTKVHSSQNNNIVVHQDKVGGKKNFDCKLCSATCNTLVGFFKHMRTHHQENVKQFWIHCQYCKLSYPSKTSLEKHVFRRHSSQNQPAQAILPTASTKKSSNLTTCHLCNLHYSKHWDMFAHMRKKHPTFVKRIWKACAQCSKLFPTQGTVRAHAAKVHGVKALTEHGLKPKCQLTFPTQTVLKNHNHRSHKNQVQELNLVSHCETDLNLDELDINFPWLRVP